MREIPEIYVDKGTRTERSLNDETKPIRKAFLTCPGVHVVESGQPVKSSAEPTLVYLISQTEHPAKYEALGLTVYPSSELVEKTSNKTALHDYLRSEHIPTPPTLRMPYDWLRSKRSIRPMQNIAKAMRFVLKPMDFTGRRTADLPKHYPNYTEDRANILEAEQPFNTEMVLQPNKGEVIKTFGCLPDLFFYEDTDGKTQECPPNIKHTCRKIFEDLNMPFGGIDFVSENQALWQVIDVNATTGGRALPAEAQAQFETTMHQHIKALLEKKKIEPTRKPEIQIVVAAGGESSRLKEVTAGPKALLPLGDRELLDHALQIPQALTKAPGFSKTTEIVVQHKHHEDFRSWQTRSVAAQGIKILSSYVKENKSSYTDVVNSQTDIERDLILEFAADRMYLNLTDEALTQLALEIHRALVIEKSPYVIVGTEEENSKYLYEVDVTTNTVISVFTQQELASGRAKRKFSDGVTKLIGIKKICYGWDMVKVTVIQARNTTEMTRQMLEAGCPGKFILLPKVDITDIDEPADYEAAKQRLSKLS